MDMGWPCSLFLNVSHGDIHGKFMGQHELLSHMKLCNIYVYMHMSVYICFHRDCQRGVCEKTTAQSWVTKSLSAPHRLKEKWWLSWICTSHRFLRINSRTCSAFVASGEARLHCEWKPFAPWLPNTLARITASFRQNNCSGGKKHEL